MMTMESMAVRGLDSQFEPAASAAIAYFLFTEIPSALQIIGSVVILAGIFLATLGQTRSNTS